jgi:hypothetical protein
MADGIACGKVTPKPNKGTSSQHYEQRPNALVWSDSTVGVSNWVGSAKGSAVGNRQSKRFFYTQQSTTAMADGLL